MYGVAAPLWEIAMASLYLTSFCVILPSQEMLKCDLIFIITVFIANVAETSVKN